MGPRYVSVSKILETSGGPNTFYRYWYLEELQYGHNHKMCLRFLIFQILISWRAPLRAQDVFQILTILESSIGPKIYFRFWYLGELQYGPKMCFRYWTVVETLLGTRPYCHNIFFFISSGVVITDDIYLSKVLQTLKFYKF